MEDDELLYDVYGDLETFDMGEKLKEVNKEVAELEKRLNDALDKLTVLRTENKRLSSESKVLRANNASLLLTANNELRRKDNEIQTLRREKDDICFRRNIAPKAPPKPPVSTVSIQTDVTFSTGDQIDIRRHGQTNLTLNVLPAEQHKHKPVEHDVRHYHHRHHAADDHKDQPKAHRHHRHATENSSHHRHNNRPAAEDAVKSGKNPFHRRRSTERYDRDQRAADKRTVVEGTIDAPTHQRNVLPIKRVRTDELSHPPGKRTRTEHTTDDAGVRPERVRRAEKHKEVRSRSRDSNKSAGRGKNLAESECGEKSLPNHDNDAHLTAKNENPPMESSGPRTDSKDANKTRKNGLNGDHHNTVSAAVLSLAPCEVQLERLDVQPDTKVKLTEQPPSTTKPDKPKTTQRRSHEKKSSHKASRSKSRDFRPEVETEQVLSKKIEQLFGVSSDEQSSPAKVPADCQTNAVEPKTPFRGEESRQNIDICKTPLSSLATQIFAERVDNRNAPTEFLPPQAVPPTTSTGSAATSPGNCSTASSTTLHITEETVDQIELCIRSNRVDAKQPPTSNHLPPPLPTSSPPPPPPKPPASPPPKPPASPPDPMPNAAMLDVTVMEEFPMDIDYELTTSNNNNDSRQSNTPIAMLFDVLEMPRKATASPFTAIVDSGSLISSGETAGIRSDATKTMAEISAVPTDVAPSSAEDIATEPQTMTASKSTNTTTKARLSDQSFMREMLTTEPANISGDNLQSSQHDESVLLPESQSSSQQQQFTPDSGLESARPQSPYEDYNAVRDISSLSEFCAPTSAGAPRLNTSSRSTADSVRELLDTLGRTPEHFDDPTSGGGAMLLPSQSPAGPIGEDELLASEMQLNLSVSKLLPVAGGQNDSLNSSGEQRRIHSTSRMSWYVMEDAGVNNVSGGNEAAVDNCGGGGDDDDDGDGPLMVVVRKKRHRSRKSGNLVK